MKIGAGRPSLGQYGWDLRSARSESTRLHRHTMDYLYIVIGDGTLQATGAEEHQRPVQTMATVFYFSSF
jgi:hypothetical protein